MYTNKRAHLNQFKVFGETNRIISSPHRELIIKELSEKYKKMNWITSRFICGYYALVAISSKTHNR
jgi:hypothetical protein